MDGILDPHAAFSVGPGDIVLFVFASDDPAIAAHNNERHRVVGTYTDPEDGIDRATLDMLTTGGRLISPFCHLTMVEPAPPAGELALVPAANIAPPAPIVRVERQPKTAAQRVRDSETRRRARGEVAVKVWVPDTAEARADVRAFAAALVAKHAKAAS
jgi:hypothetical protein